MPMIFRLPFDRWWVTYRAVFQVEVVYCLTASPFWISQGIAVVLVRFSDENHKLLSNELTSDAAQQVFI